uniref:Small ribosomal subunit protein uS3c n=2 Tax=Psilotum nudum TaxID=3240 RepID=RR3_PSINU|nr:ribosomal protein S3 [Psilotum nudum]Q8WHY4.1 RecName: Full=Small ribosomal subunit protein uS3c; AltName: Full=30S ribosomal protein S3, chloroplastic [Psilotum nudum]AGC26832.1 ribosomal protein S3 [Psilotum nudum]BAB84255.1 ribosomal protein S3 [Psilotum nudum]
MGQKIHPLGFRLGTTQNHCSYWFAQSKKIYSKLVKEDKEIRNCIEKYVQKHTNNPFHYGGIARIEIYRKTDLIRVEIHMGFTDLLTENGGIRFEQLKSNIEKIVNSKNQKLCLILIKIDKPYTEPKVLAEYIALQLENRVVFRKAVKKALELAGNFKNKGGIKIQIAGRLNGIEIARVEWTREGRVPLQTIRAHINYYYYPAKTIYGILGIKVWIYQNDE